MNYDQWTGILRTIVPALAAYAVGKGWVPEGAATDLAMGIVALGSAVWSIFNNKSGKIVPTTITGK